MTTATAARHEYMDTREAAGYLGISANTLNCWRSRREGPPFCKIGGKVRYRLADLDAWADGRRRDPSSRL
ncbi:MAG: helix-turn-helix domain-containing protein [Stellaceae bacterium]